MRKKQNRALVALGLAGLMVFGAGATAQAAVVNMTLVYDGKAHAYAAEEVHLVVDGETLTGLDMPPVIVNDRTLAPLRAIAEKLGATVNWNGDTKEAYLVKDNNVVVVQIDNATGSRNGEAFAMDVAPKIINDRTMLPVRAIAEALDCQVGWDGNTRTVTVGTKDAAPTPSTPDNSQTETPGATATTAIRVTGVSVPAADAAQTFTIQASGAIEKYEDILVGSDRLAVDVYNAECGMAANQTLTNNPAVSSIRAAQNQVTPVKVTRVVFDLKGGGDYTVRKSSDGKSLLVTFPATSVTGLSVKSNKSIDTVSIAASAQPVITETWLTNPNRLVVDIQNAESSLRSSYSASSSDYIRDIRTSQYTANSVRVVLELADGVDYAVDTDPNGCTVQVYKSNLKNISYNSSSRVLTLKKTDGLNVADIVENDDYLNRVYTLTLPGNYEDAYGYGVLRVQDDDLGRITLDTSGQGHTTITFYEKAIRAYTISQDSENIYINVQNPKEKYSKVVLIDAGHGGSDPGAAANGLTEKTLNLSILQKVMARFEQNSSIKAYATRLGDTYPQNISRAEMGNELADLFISIHQNSTPGATAASGIEVYYTPHSNEVSGHLTSKIAATTLAQYLSEYTGANNRGAKNDPALIVLNKSTTNATLVECGFLTNAEEAAKLGTSAYQDEIADAIYDAVVELLSRYPTR